MARLDGEEGAARRGRRGKTRETGVPFWIPAGKTDLADPRQRARGRKTAKKEKKPVFSDNFGSLYAFSLLFWGTSARPRIQLTAYRAR